MNAKHVGTASSWFNPFSPKQCKVQLADLEGEQAGLRVPAREARESSFGETSLRVNGRRESWIQLHFSNSRLVLNHIYTLFYFLYVQKFYCCGSKCLGATWISRYAVPIQKMNCASREWDRSPGPYPGKLQKTWNWTRISGGPNGTVTYGMTGQ